MCLLIFLVLKLVIDFTATWCGPCRFIEPAFKEFSVKYTDVEFIKIDVDELEVWLSVLAFFLFSYNGCNHDCNNEV